MTDLTGIEHIHGRQNWRADKYRIEDLARRYPWVYEAIEWAHKDVAFLLKEIDRLNEIDDENTRLRNEVERLTQMVGAFSSARDEAKRGWQAANDKIARVEELIHDVQEVIQ